MKRDKISRSQRRGGNFVPWLERLESRRLLVGDLVNHWLADDLVASLADGAQVEVWSDSIAQAKANHVTSAPRLVHDALGGRAALRFDAADGGDLLQVGLQDNPMSQVADFSVTVVFATSGNLTGTNEPWYTNTGLVDGSNLGFTQDWGISLNAEGRPSVGMGSGFLSPSTTLYSLTSGINDGQPHVVSFTRDGARMSLYVDDHAPDQRSGADDAPRARNEMVFGGLLSRANYFTGEIGEVRVFDGELSSEEVAALHQERLRYYRNQIPTTVDDAYVVDEDQPLQVAAANGLLANDLDDDGDPLTAVLVTEPQHGQLILQPDGSFVYTPDANYFGADSFSYYAEDFRAASPATVNLQVRPVHDPVLTAPDYYQTSPAIALVVSADNGVLQNDVNIDSSPLTVVLSRDVDHGQLMLNADGSFEYTPQGFTGRATFDYQVDDGVSVSDPESVTIRVNTRPQAAPDSYETQEDTELIIDAQLGLLANDHDEDGDPLTVMLRTPLLGSLDLRPDGSFRYMPPTDYDGTDLFGYVASDGAEESLDTFVQIHVHPVNDAPRSVPDQFFTLTDQVLTIDVAQGVLANDIDVDMDRLTAELVRGPNSGSVSLNADGSFQYSPRAGFEGDDSFVYRATDSLVLGPDTEVTIRVTSQPLIISEFLASNSDILETRTRSSADSSFRGGRIAPDWIEIHNVLSQSIDLQGMHLTNDERRPRGWQFPANTIIPPFSYLVVFASGDNITDSALDENGYLHTDFELDSEGGYLALTSADGKVIHEYARDYPTQRTDISYGTASDDAQQLGYFLRPTPGSENDLPRVGAVEDTRFSVDRGFFDEPFQLELTTRTSGASIRYTVDGSEPREDHGQLYTRPITIDRTTALRAIGFKDGMLPTNTDTQTYLFLDDILDQSSTPPEGFPRTWGNTPTDWGMDQDVEDLARIAGNENFSLEQSRQVIKDSLLSLPTISLVSPIDGIFGSRDGIYANTQGRGEQWERPTSVEYIDPNGQAPGFQIDAGLRVQGFTSRDPSRNPKHSLRLVFRGEYGDTRLRYPLFGPDAATSFDTIILRSNAQDAWVYDSESNRQGQFIRDEWARATQLEMGQPAAHGTWVHLYINGLYWGLYNPTERPDSSFTEEYLGGDKSDYDILKNHEEFIDGTKDAYEELLAIIQRNPRDFSAGYRDLSDDAEYQKLLGNNADGTRNPDLPVLLDVQNLIDFVIVGAYAAATDWPGNFYMGRDRTENSTGFKTFMWDNEHGMKSGVRENRVVPHSRDNDSPTKFYHAMRSNKEFRLLFADRLHYAFFNGGPLYVDQENQQWDPQHPERNVPAARWMEITSHIEEALIAEAARWGDYRRIQYTPHDQFQSLRNQLLRSWFPGRSEIVFEQFKRLDLYPDHQAPVFQQHGGQIPVGYRLEIENPNNRGIIYYTLDGSDPRNSQTVYSQPISLNGNVTVKARILLDGEWSALNEATFTDAIPATASSLRISEIHYNPAPPTDAEIAAGFTDNDEFEFIELVNISDHTIDLQQAQLSQETVNDDLEGVYFRFADGPVVRLAPNETVLVVENVEAFVHRYGNNKPVAGQWSGKLNNGGETVTLRVDNVILQQFAYSDDWYPNTDGRGHSLEVVNPAAADLTLWSQPTGWRESRSLGGSPGTIDSQPIPGDSNHDGIFDSSDLVLVFQAGEYEDAIDGNSTFEEGDWNLDGDFTTADLVLAFRAGHFVAAAQDETLGVSLRSKE